MTINRPKSPGRRRRTSQHSEEAQPSEPLFLNLLLPQCDSSGKSKPSNAPLVYYAELPRTAASYAHRIQRRKSPCHTTSEAEETENANVGCVTVKSECGQLSISYNAGAVQETGAPQVSAQTALPTVTCTPVCPLPMVCAPLCYYEVPQQTMMTMMTPLPPPTLMPPTPSPSPFYRSASRRKSRRARSSSRRGRSKSRKRQLPYTLSLALHGEPGTVASTQTEAQFEPPSLYRRPTFISPKPSVSPKWPAESPPTRPIVQHKIVYQKTVPCMEDNYCVPCVPGVYTELSSDGRFLSHLP
uniref:Uncharacterized protein n=1 Tax=Schistocephalus solidus TaxID=70667 RepID=A0A0X3NKK7_SCHSO